MQAKLKDTDIPVGVVSDAKKEEIFTNGVLNDVSTAHFVRGEANRALGQKKVAIEAYRNALKLGVIPNRDGLILLRLTKNGSFLFL